MSSSPLQKLLLHWQWTVAAITALVVIGGVALLWMPEYSRMQQFDARELRAKGEERVRLEQTRIELVHTQKSFDGLDPARKERILTLLPRAVSFTQLLMTMTQIASQVGFSVESFSLQESQPMSTEKGKSADGERVQFQVRVAGRGYEPWKRFLAAVERQLPIMDFLSTQYKPETLAQDFSFVTYILP